MVLEPGIALRARNVRSRFEASDSCKLVALGDILEGCGFAARAPLEPGARDGGGECESDASIGSGSSVSDSCEGEDRGSDGGAESAGSDDEGSAGFVGGGGERAHKVLVFSQLAGMLDAVEQGLLAPRFPGLRCGAREESGKVRRGRALGTFASTGRCRPLGAHSWPRRWACAAVRCALAM